MNWREALTTKRTVLAVGWTLCLIVSFGLLAYVDWTQYQSTQAPEGFREPIEQAYKDTFTAYAVYMTTMFGCIYARKKMAAPKADAGAAGFVLALLVTLVWNGMFIFYTSRVAVFQNMTIQDLAGVRDMLTKAAFLVNPFLGYYFGSADA